mmetsp:Transcript_2549/g.6538  ORF Transcript_2549/g.6538 Transcript_2549/m.6538 type:complete len:207 (-) Transcript_2549:294-914(-)
MDIKVCTRAMLYMPCPSYHRSCMEFRTYMQEACQPQAKHIMQPLQSAGFGLQTHHSCTCLPIYSSSCTSQHNTDVPRSFPRKCCTRCFLLASVCWLQPMPVSCLCTLWALGQQQGAHSCMAPSCCLVQRCLPISVLQASVSPCVQQGLHHLGMSLCSCTVQRGRLAACRHRIHTRAVLEQQLNCLGAPRTCSVVQRGVACGAFTPI